jgi:hypothetical protein
MEGFYRTAQRKEMPDSTCLLRLPPFPKEAWSGRKLVIGGLLWVRTNPGLRIETWGTRNWYEDNQRQTSA